jgi:hypothetical protein
VIDITAHFKNSFRPKTIPGSLKKIHHNMQKNGESSRLCEEIFKKKAGKISSG